MTVSVDRVETCVLKDHDDQPVISLINYIYILNSNNYSAVSRTSAGIHCDILIEHYWRVNG